MSRAGLSPSAERAVEILRAQVSKLDGLRQSDSGDSAFVQWRTTTAEILKRYLTNTGVYIAFINIRFDPPLAGYMAGSEVTHAFERACDKARGCLNGAIEHIEMFDLDEGGAAKRGFTRVVEEEKDVATNKGSPLAKSAVLVLISHSAKDKLLAEALIELLRAGLGLLADEIRCTSVDGYRLPAGVDTNEELRREIRAVQVLIGLLTPNSISSTYVLFELGARWGAELSMIPLLAGVLPEDMRGPHAVLNALSCGVEAQVVQLVEDVGKELGRHPQRAASYLKHVHAVVEAAKSVTRPMHPSSPASSPASGNNMGRMHLADLISELEDNLGYARGPRIGDAFVRPSNEVWKRVRNVIVVPEGLRSKLTDIYREIDGWLTVVESGVHPNMGSPALNAATTSLRTKLPSLIEELQRLP